MVNAVLVITIISLVANYLLICYIETLKGKLALVGVLFREYAKAIDLEMAELKAAKEIAEVKLKEE